eukprot:CAMPEP_0174879284 /NCGR_PEP_ID=MMETSP1114-20130205/83184_1 /TAXON_ID=312471 /ORGANISM="Neobodo designis, Strain CCAP 1951/1" /LENGTH=371 /DNA_ID=CAMNT_0016114677 /DNA_START=59 /DNA_END=1173 /DNA_ORIENTATION=-
MPYTTTPKRAVSAPGECALGNAVSGVLSRAFDAAHGGLVPRDLVQATVLAAKSGTEPISRSAVALMQLTTDFDDGRFLKALLEELLSLLRTANDAVKEAASPTPAAAEPAPTTLIAVGPGSGPSDRHRTSPKRAVSAPGECALGNAVSGVLSRAFDAAHGGLVPRELVQATVLAAKNSAEPLSQSAAALMRLTTDFDDKRFLKALLEELLSLLRTTNDVATEAASPTPAAAEPAPTTLIAPANDKRRGNGGRLANPRRRGACADNANVRSAPAPCLCLDQLADVFPARQHGGGMLGDAAALFSWHEFDRETPPSMGNDPDTLSTTVQRDDHPVCTAETRHAMVTGVLCDDSAARSDAGPGSDDDDGTLGEL